MANRELPRRGSSAQLALTALHNIGGSSTIPKLMRVRDWVGPKDRFYADVIDRLVRAGLVDQNGDAVDITSAGREYLGVKQQEAIEGPELVIVGPRYVAPMRPLNLAKHFPPRPQRESGAEFRRYPSVMGDQRVAYSGAAATDV